MLIGPLGVEVHLGQALVGLGGAQIAIHRAITGDEIRLVGGEQRGIIQGRETLAYIQRCVADVTHHLIGTANHVVDGGVADQLGIGIAELVVIATGHLDALDRTTAADAALGNDRQVVGGDGGRLGCGARAGGRCGSSNGLGLEWEEVLINSLIEGMVIEIVADNPLLFIGNLLVDRPLVSVVGVIDPCSCVNLNLIDLRLVAIDLLIIHAPATLIWWQGKLSPLSGGELERRWGFGIGNPQPAVGLTGVPIGDPVVGVIGAVLPPQLIPGGKDGGFTGEFIGVIQQLQAHLVHHRGERLAGIEQSALIHRELQIAIDLDGVIAQETGGCNEGEGTPDLAQGRS